MADPGLAQIALLAAVALVAGTVDAIAGGGGLVTLPALLASGLPPHVALGTNKGQSVFGAFAALVRFSRSGLVDAQRARLTFPLGLAGSLCGAALVLAVPPAVLRPVVLALLAAAALFIGLRRRGPARLEDAPPPARARLLAGAAALLIGAYDGFFGPGTGTFLIVAFVALLGDGLAHASASAKVVNFASNLAAMALFAAMGTVAWRIALPMAGAQLAGAGSARTWRCDGVTRSCAGWWSSSRSRSPRRSRGTCADRDQAPARSGVHPFASALLDSRSPRIAKEPR